MKKFIQHNPRRIAIFIVGILAILGVIFSQWNPFSSVLSATSSAGNVPSQEAPVSATSSKPASTLFQYVEVTDACGPYFDGTCVNMRSGPGLTYPVVLKLRNGMVLKVVNTVVADGHTWYKIGFDGEVHYPERVVGGWYVAADYVHVFLDKGQISTTHGINATSTKRIVVDLTNETLYAYDGNTLFMQQLISTGLELTPTPKGTFWVYRKTPDSYMQGPIPGLSDQYYDLPGVPWDLYFTMDGGAIHGAYWHNHFGVPWSHGCVNLPPDQAKILYEWADLGTPVVVQI